MYSISCMCPTCCSTPDGYSWHEGFIEWVQISHTSYLSYRDCPENITDGVEDFEGVPNLTICQNGETRFCQSSEGGHQILSNDTNYQKNWNSTNKAIEHI